jgi:two-component system sensor histidine kinase TctE
MLRDTLWRQALLVALVVLIVLVVVQRATRPVRRISDAIEQRPQGDLSPLQPSAVPRELQPLLNATNQVMDRLRPLLAHQKRFVRDASHQLRTPLAVLKTQVQSARRGDMPPEQALAEIEATVDRATRLANQMLALAKVEQLRQQAEAPTPQPWEQIVRDVALDLAPLVADKTGLRAAGRPAGAGGRPGVDAARAHPQPAAQRHPPRAAGHAAAGAAHP